MGANCEWLGVGVSTNPFMRPVHPRSAHECDDTSSGHTHTPHTQTTTTRSPDTHTPEYAHTSEATTPPLHSRRGSHTPRVRGAWHRIPVEYNTETYTSIESCHTADRTTRDRMCTQSCSSHSSRSMSLACRRKSHSCNREHSTPLGESPHTYTQETTTKYEHDVVGNMTFAEKGGRAARRVGICVGVTEDQVH